MHDNNYYKQLAFKYFEGELISGERAVLYDFISRNPQNQKQYHLWEEEYREKCMSDTELDNFWNEFKDKNNIIPETTPITRKEKSRKKIYLTLLRAACILLLLLSSNYIVYKLTSKSDVTKSIAFIDYYVPNGEIKTLYLPDSTCVTLNAGSYIFYPETFTAGERTIHIYGEAHLDVKKDGRPFYVKTHDFTVEVLGTVFNVYAYPHQANSVITLESGRINLLFNDHEETYTLLPSDRILYNRLTGDIIKDNDSRYASGWLQGKLYFEKTPLQEIIERLERKYDVNIHMLRKNLFDYKATVKFTEEETLEDILTVLQKLIPEINRYTISENQVYIE